MGHTSSSVKAHMETAQKTGALVLSNRKLVTNEVPDLSSMGKVLRTLDLSVNKLISLPPSVCSLTNLRHLTLNNNKISWLPEEIGSLTKLESFSIASNQLGGLPASISKLKHLKSVILSDNKLVEFPLSLCGLTHLDVVDLSNNQITLIPEEAKELQAVELNMNQNQVSQLSSAIASCPRLRTLRLEENCLSLSAIPMEILTNSQVSLFCVDGNLFKMKELEYMAEYNQYMERFTAVKKKMY